MINKLIRFFIWVIPFVVLVSCNQKEVYYKYTSIPQNEWRSDDELCFVLDSTTNINPDNRYTVSLEIVHSIDYSYENLFLYVDKPIHDSSGVMQDTLECTLVDNKGKWKGSGNGATRHLSVPYRVNIKLDSALHNELCIRHAMHDVNLKGIEKIGLKVY